MKTVNFRRTSEMVLMIFIVLMIYTALHKIAHVIFRDTQEIIMVLSGVLLPLVIGWIFLFITRKSKIYSLYIFRGGVVGILLVSLIPWILNPIFYQWNKQFLFGDSYQFMTITHLNGYVVALFFFSLSIILGMHFIELIDNYKNIRNRKIFTFKKPITKRMYYLIFVISIIVIAVNSISIFKFSEKDIVNKNIPVGYKLVKSIDLSEQNWKEEVIQQWELKGTELLGVLIVLEKVKTPYIHIQLIPQSKNEKEDIYYAENLSVEQDSSRFEKQYNSGRYLLVLSSKKSLGIVKFYLKN